MKKVKLIETVSKGSHVRKTVDPELVIGDASNGYDQGDILDANSVQEKVEDIQETISGLDDVYAPKVENGYIENPDIDGVSGQILSLDSLGNTVWSNPTEGSVTDSTMSDISENPVQNKTIKAYVDSTIYDISVNHPTSGVDDGNTYASLSAALAVIPQNKQKGGMTVRYIQSSDNKYVQYRYKGTATTGTPNPFLDTANWQGVDKTPTAGSENTVESGGVTQYIFESELQNTKIETDYLNMPCAIIDSGIFYNSGRHASLPVQYGETFYLLTSADTTNFAFATNNNVTADSPVPIVDGTEVIRMKKNVPYRCIIPNGCNYLLFDNMNDTTCYRVSNCIDLEDKINNEISRATGVEAQLEEDLFDCQNNISIIADSGYSIIAESFYGNLNVQTNEVIRTETSYGYGLNKYLIKDGVSKVKIKTVLPANNLCGQYAFYGVNGPLSSPVAGVSTKQSVTYDLNVPEGTTELYVSVAEGETSEVYVFPNFDDKIEDIIAANTIDSYERQYYLKGVDTAYYVSQSGTLVDTAPAFYRSMKFDVSAIRTQIKVATTLSEYYVRLYAVCDANNNVLTYGERTSLSREAVIQLQNIPLAKYLYVCYDATQESVSTAKLLYTVMDAINGRKRMDITTNETELDIFNKLLKAFNEGGYDVYFEFGTYTFSNIYLYMRDTLGWLAHTSELPIGGGCRYFFNNSTLISNAPDGYSGDRNLLGCRGTVQSFELYDATLINNEGLYVVHDEGANNPGFYHHKYHNITMKFNTSNTTQLAGKCLGMGAGQYGIIEIDNCVLLSQATKTLDWHGNAVTEQLLDVRILISNSYFNKLVLIREIREGDNGVLIFNNNRADAIDFSNTFDIIEFNNSIVNP